MEHLKAFLPINFALLTPVNIVIITVIVLVGGLALGLIFHPANDEDASDA